MGTHITNRFLVIVFLFYSASCASINEKEIADAKGFALCDCFRIMSREIDSLSIIGKNDKSNSYFVQMSTLELEEIVQIGNFVKQNVSNFIGIPYDGEHNKKLGKPHMVGYTCWQLYISNELDSFVKNILKNRQ